MKRSSSLAKLARKSAYWAAGSAAALAIAAAAGKGICAYRAGRAIDRAREELRRGFSAVAADTLDPYRHELVDRDENCKVLITAYFNAHRADRLEWASQACLEAEREIPEVYLGQAAAQEMTGRDGDAIQTLNTALAKFSKDAAIYYSLAKILRKHQQDAPAIAAYKQAIALSGDDHSALLELFDYYGELQRWGDAKPLAEKLKSVQTTDPDLKLRIARVLIKTGEPDAAKPLVAAALDFIKQHPDSQAILEKTYPDVLGATTVKAQ